MTKNLSKILSVILAICLIFSIGAIGVSAENSGITITPDKDTGSVNVSINVPDLSNDNISVICFDPTWDNDLENWQLKQDSIVYIDQYQLEDGKADFSFTINKAPVDGNYSLVIGSSQTPIVEQFSFTCKIPTPEISISTDKQTYLQNAPITVTVTAPSDMDQISFVNEYGKTISNTLLNASLNNNNSITWTFVMSIATKGDRIINVMNGNEKIGSFNVKINVGSAPVDESASAEIISANANSKIVLAGKNFDVKVVTGKGCSNIAFTNEYGNEMGKILVSKEIKDDTIEWTYTMNIGSKGIRTITAKSADADGNWLDKTADFIITVVK